ncbi:META domain-containing protein [Klugiella xanthotipulae]|uniref:META domain-containing protein n=1 Tax=Klugiella xanthotipulae TaxID=244735 RepID=A0A543HYX2_9MICO|nr:META domain-containing protein [Klugiella xanthotipulae]TQM63531.1 META domain-containing protein [Klugiella xanthotipulae]
MNRTPLIVVLAAATALLLGGCAAPLSSDPGDPVGTWGDAEAQNTPFLVVDAGGTISGSDGCNRLSGTWSQEGDTVTFDQTASTLMACDGVDLWLSAARSATVDGDTLTVSNDTNEKIGTLTRTR